MADPTTCKKAYVQGAETALYCDLRENPEDLHTPEWQAWHDGYAFGGEMRNAARRMIWKQAETEFPSCPDHPDAKIIKARMPTTEEGHWRCLEDGVISLRALGWTDTQILDLMKEVH